MNDHLQGKRLLILGGSIWKDAIKSFAEEHGIHLISAGLYPAGIDEIAQESYRIDTTDGELMKTFIREHQVDGVYMGGSELIISAACQYINELGLPCYCTKEQWDAVQNKHYFKSLCQKFGLPVVHRYYLDTKHIEDSILLDAYPVVLKPADGCGSNGFSVCHTSQELVSSYQEAANNSPTGTVICEKFVKNEAVCVFYTISGDEISFCGSEAKVPIKYEKQGSYVAGLFLFPSHYEQEFRDRFEKKIEAMFKSIGLYEGSVWIEVFHDGDDYFFNEAGFRYGGSVSVYPVDYLSGVNQVNKDIYFALTGESLKETKPSLIPATINRNRYYCVYPVHADAGTIIHYQGVDVLRNRHNMAVFVLTKLLGATIQDTGSFGQIIALAHFVFSSKKECEDTIEAIHDTFEIIDETGHNLVHRRLEKTDLRNALFEELDAHEDGNNKRINTPPICPVRKCISFNRIALSLAA